MEIISVYDAVIAFVMEIWKYGGSIFICHPGLKILFICIFTHSFNLTLCFEANSDTMSLVWKYLGVCL